MIHAPPQDPEQNLKAPRGWLSGGLLLVAAVIAILAVAGTWYAFSVVRQRYSALGPEHARIIENALTFAGTVSLLIPLLLVTTAFYVRRTRRARPLKGQPIWRFGLPGLIGLVTFVAIAIRFPAATLVVTVAIPIAVLILAGCVAAVLYPAAVIARLFRESKAAPLDSKCDRAAQVARQPDELAQ